MSESNRPTAAGRWLWRAVTVLILAAGVGGYVALQVFKPRPEVRAPAKQYPLVRVAPLEYGEGTLSVRGHGLVRPRAEIVLGAEVAGRVIELHPSLVTGGALAKNDLLVRLDPEPFRAALAQAQAERRSAQAALDLATRQLKRTEELIAQGFLSRQTLDERNTARDQAQAALARAEAAERGRTLDLERSVIRAPFRARVLTERVDVGDAVQPGRELARLFADDVLEVAVSLTDRDMALVASPWNRAGARGAEDTRSGAAARLRVEHGGRRFEWPARVDRVEASVDSATRTWSVVVRVDAPNAPGRPLSGEAAGAPPLTVGMYAEALIAGRDVGRTARVPRRALRDDSVLWLLGEGSTIEVRPVRVLIEEDDVVVVSAAELPPAATVVVSDLRVVTHGMRVRVIGEGAAPAKPAS